MESELLLFLLQVDGVFGLSHWRFPHAVRQQREQSFHHLTQREEQFNAGNSPVDPNLCICVKGMTWVI